MAANLSDQARLKAQDTFLASFVGCGNVTQSAKKARVDRSLIYQWQEHDEIFGLRFNQAKEAYNDTLRAEIHRRAVIGILDPVYFQGARVGTVRKYSDTLLIFHAKAKMPEYRTDAPVEDAVQKAYAGFDLEDV